jgi:hypothetical protein
MDRELQSETSQQPGFTYEFTEKCFPCAIATKAGGKRNKRDRLCEIFHSARLYTRLGDECLVPKAGFHNMSYGAIIRAIDPVSGHCDKLSQIALRKASQRVGARVRWSGNRGRSLP